MKKENAFVKRRTNALRFADFGAMLVFSGDFEKMGEDFLYFTGKHIDSSILLLRKKCPPILFSSKLNARLAGKTGIRTVIYEKKKPFLLIVKFLKGVKQIGVDFSFISHAQYRRLKLGLKRKKFLDCGKKMLLQRMVKEKGEIRQIARAQEMARKIITGIKLSKNMTEQDVARIILQKTLKAGCTPAFPPIVASSSSSSNPHYPPQNKKLKGIVMIDYGVKFGDYCSDMTRCFFLGKCEKERALYAKLQEISREIYSAIPKLKYVRQLDALYLSLFKKHSLPAPIHLLGHGVGLELHEYPSIRSRARERICPGMVFTIEPGAYLKRYGARYENLIYFDGRKVKVL